MLRVEASRESRRHQRLVPVLGVLLLLALVVLLPAVAERGRSAEARGAAADTLLPPQEDPLALGFPAGRSVETQVFGAEAAVAVDDGWVVLDARSRRLAYLTPDGDLRHLAGRRGTGPGELDRPVGLARAGDRIVVVEATGRLVAFDLEGGHAGDARLARLEGCNVSTFVAVLSGPDSLPLLSNCAKGGGRLAARVDLVAPDGNRRTIAEFDYMDPRSGPLDPMRIPMLVRIDGRLAFGIGTDRCLRPVADGGHAGRLLCYPHLPLQAVPDSIRKDLERSLGSLAQRGVTMELPEHLPPFRALLDGGGTWGFLSLPAEGGEAIDLVEGGRLRRFLLPPETRAFLDGERLLLARESAEGTRFAVVSIRSP